MIPMLKEIALRRSVRSYTSAPIVREKMEAVLQAGNHAPTGCNRQNLLFVGILDAKIRDALFEYLDGGRAYYGATGIVLVFERTKDPLTLQNAGAAMENMLLEAVHQGLSACWIHSVVASLNAPKGKAFLRELPGLDDEYDLVESLALGYSDEKTQEKKRNAENVVLL